MSVAAATARSAMPLRASTGAAPTRTSSRAALSSPRAEGSPDMAGAVRDDATRWFAVSGSFGQHGSAGQRPFPRLPPAHRPCISGHGRGRGALHLAHGHGRGAARGPRGRAAQPTTPGAAGGGQDHTPGPHTRGIPPISRSLTQVYEQRRGMDADGKRNVRRRRKYEEFEADDGTVLRYARHPNGGGLVERTAH